MAINDATRFTLEVLAKAEVIIGLTHQGAEVLAAADLAANTDTLRAARFAFEVLAKQPATAAMSHQGAEVLADADELSPASSDTLEIPRYAMEVLVESPDQVALSHQGAEVLADAGMAAITDALDVTRLAFEVLGRRFVGLTGFTVPTGLLHYKHNWVDGISLTSSYDTDISMAALTVSEERRQLLDRPKRELEINWLVTGGDAIDAFLVELRRYNQEKMGVPVYMDTSELTSDAASAQNIFACDTTRRRFFPNGMVVIVEYGAEGAIDTVEYIQILDKTGDKLRFKTNLTNNFTAGKTVVMPLMLVHELLDLKYEAITEHTFAVKATFSEIYGKTALPPLAADVPSNFDSYLGHPILDVEPNWETPMEVTLLREGTMQTEGRGEQADTRGARHRVVHGFNFLEQRTRAWDILSFFDSRRGRARPFWVIDRENVWDVLVLDHVNDRISIAPLGDLTAFQDEMDYVGLVFEDGTSMVREAVLVEDVLGVWRITLDSPMPAGYTPADVKRFGRARITRNRDDSITEEWVTSDALKTNIETIELLEEKDVDLS
jgi:hypothetical protein